MQMHQLIDDVAAINTKTDKIEKTMGDIKETVGKIKQRVDNIEVGQQRRCLPRGPEGGALPCMMKGCHWVAWQGSSCQLLLQLGCASRVNTSGLRADRLR